jgi:multiple sugar transport system substrate-binding protein
MTRRVPTLLALALLALATSGCSSSASADRPVTIRYAFWGAFYEMRIWKELARRFEERQDRIRIKLEHIPQTAYHPKLLAMHVGRCSPDVMAVDDEPFPELADNGIFEDLGPWIERDPAIDPAAFYPQFLQAWSYRGKQYALPYDGHDLIIYYNKAHLRSAGLPEPPADWTWDDYLRYARKLTRDLDGDGRTDQYGVMRPYNLYHSLPWVWSAGGNEFDPQITRWALNTPEGLRGIRFCYDIVHKERIAPRLSDLPGMTPENMFLTGGVSMVIHGPWWLQMCRKAQGLEWDVQHLPIGPKGRATRTTCEGLAISASSRQKEAAWEWIRFALGEEGQTVFAQYERGMPSVRSVAERVFPNPKTPQHEERFLEAMRYARCQRIPVQYKRNDSVIVREWELMLLGHRTPEQLAANLESGVNKIMAEPR